MSNYSLGGNDVFIGTERTRKKKVKEDSGVSTKRTKQVYRLAGLVCSLEKPLRVYMIYDLVLC